jgi:AraC-like DNA-binding protein
MLDTHPITVMPGLGVHRVGCDSNPPGWSPDEVIVTFAAILVTDGMYRRRVNGIEQTVDPVTAYFQCEGEEQRVFHPAGGDTTTVIVPSERLLGSLGDPDRLSGTTLLITPESDLAHRMLLARAAACVDREELAERATALLGGLIDTDRLIHPQATSTLDRRLAARVRESLDAEVRVSLLDMATETGFSAYRLSRAFQRVTGLTLTSYRSRLRTRRALARLAEGDRDLAGIAVDVGFADQAHMTRSLRSDSGMTPRTLRRILGPPPIPRLS